MYILSVVVTVVVSVVGTVMVGSLRCRGDVKFL